jgi:hypothetical protein
MKNVLIAYNDSPQAALHNFFTQCADDAKQICLNNKCVYTPVCPPNLNEESVLGQMKTNSICFIAAHGNSEGIVNEKDEDIVSKHTTNYCLADKILYTVACCCAKSLKPELQRIGLDTFVGYDDNFVAIESNPLFRESAMEGLKSLLEGDEKDVARQRMIRKYDECIRKADSNDVKKLLINNREHLCFE